MVSLLKMQNVTVERGPVRLLNDLSIEIPLGQHVAILGPNGAGKTSLLRLLLRQLYPSIIDGRPSRIEILGSDVWNIWEMRRGMGIVSAELDRVFPGATVIPQTALQAVLTGFFGSQLPPPSAAINDEMRQTAHDCLRQVGIDGLSNRLLPTLSTGELRRVLIARALVHQPQALVLDEPTAGLDVAARYHFLNLLRQLARNGTAMLLVSHHVEEILPEIDRVILMRQGQIVVDGCKREALTTEHLKGVFDIELSLTTDSHGYIMATPRPNPTFACQPG